MTQVNGANGNSIAQDMVRICGWMYQRGFIASSEGNVSVLLEPDRILVTPGGRHKGLLQPEDLVVTDLDGCRVHGVFLPSSELQLHLAAYRERDDVRAVVHAHPTMAVACSVAGVSLAEAVIPEVVTALGAIPTAPYATPGTAEAAASISGLIREFDALILARHGSVTVGADLQDAYSKLEMIEHSAQILFFARLLGPFSPLPKDEVSRLLIAGGRNPLTAALATPQEQEKNLSK
jgi:L-fuculose-phosphate aldolase